MVMNGRVIFVTVLALKPGLEEFFLSEMVPAIEVSRQFSGCLYFDLYRLSKHRDTLVLQETWETQEAYRAYLLSPVKEELARLLTRSIAQPMQTWEVEEVC